MPRIDLHEGHGGELGNVPFEILFARDKHVIIQYAGCDSDGLVETPEDVRAAALRFRRALDNRQRSGKDTGIDRDVPISFPEKIMPIDPQTK
jgi:hypothetical protein